MSKNSVELKSALTLKAFWILSVLFLFSIFCSAEVLASDQYYVEVIGNSLKTSAQGVDYPGVVILLNTPFAKNGVVYAFRAYFRYLEATAFQIWRPSQNSLQTFRLLAEIEAVPSTNIEPIYITSKFMKCIRVQRGDRFGLFSYARPSSIGYVFNPLTSQALVHSTVNGTTINIGEIANFSTITFPYDLSSQAFYYLEDANQSTSDETLVDCPPNLSVNDVGGITTTTMAPISSGVPGAIGPQGPVGFPGPHGQPGATGPPGLTGQQGATGKQGAKGQIGTIGATGSSGSMGEMGEIGSTGPIVAGLSGATGPVGQPGPPGQLIYLNVSQLLSSEPPKNSQSTDSDWAQKWTSEMFMIGLLIWLSIISFIVLALLLYLLVISCVICAIRRHDRRIIARIKELHRNQNDPFKMIRKTSAVEQDLDSSEGPLDDDSPADTIPKGEASEAPTMDRWMGAMKEDAVHEYKMWYDAQ